MDWVNRILRVLDNVSVCSVIHEKKMKLQIEPTYKCDICGKESHWIKGKWWAHVFPIKHGETYDECEFHLCSDECDDKLLSMTKMERVKLYYGVKP
jgi:hypothetical protein